MRSKLYLLSTVLVVFPLLLSATEYYTTFATINVRNGPGTGYLLIFNTDKDALMRILGEAVLNGENPVNVHRHQENIRNLLGKHRIYE